LPVEPRRLPALAAAGHEMLHQASILFSALTLLMGGAWYSLHTASEDAPAATTADTAAPAADARLAADGAQTS
jgi:hypothetical protein